MFPPKIKADLSQQSKSKAADIRTLILQLTGRERDAARLAARFTRESVERRLKKNKTGIGGM